MTISTVIAVEHNEIEALIAWHRDQEIKHSNKSEYHDAQDHMNRRALLAKILLEWRTRS